MKRICLLLFSICFSFAYAQQEFSSFLNTGHGGATTFATDYQAAGINPANLGWPAKYDKKFTMGFSEFTGSIYSEALQKDELRNVASDMINGGGKNFTYDQKMQAANNFAQTGFVMNLDLGSFGAAYQSKVAGGFAFRVNDHFQFTSKLGSQAADLLFLGKTSSIFDSLQIQLANGATQYIANHPHLSADTAAMVLQGKSNAPKLLSKILDGTDMTLMYYRDYNFSYGRKIVGDDSVFAVYGGVGVKYIQGIALMNIKSEGGQLSGYSALSPAFGINYGTVAGQAHQVTGAGFPPKSVGSGFGFDFGADVIIGGKLKIGASVINMGSINWTGNVYQLQDTAVVSTQNSGLQNYNIISQMKNFFDGQKGLFKLKGAQSLTTQLPGMVRAGASLKLGKLAEVGVDCIVPTNNTIPGTITNPIVGMGGDLMPLPWLKIQAGFITGGNYSYQVPVGLIFIAPGGAYEAGIASRDAITFFTQKGPTISLSTGFLRFRF
jgi:hypothetical protein